MALPTQTGAEIAALVAEARKALSNPMPYDGTGLRKASVNIASGLINYDLQAPAKNLYPVNTPLRNVMPRVKGNGDKQTHWVAVTGIVGSGFDASPWVAEGQRAGIMTLNTTPQGALYATLGEEINLTYEAWAGAEGFEDEKARNSIRLLQKMMLKEENAILGGNYSVQLGTPSAPTVSNAGTLGTIAAGTYRVAVSLLTFEGFQNWKSPNFAQSIVTGIPVQITVTSPVGETMVINGGSSALSATTSTTSTGSTSTISASLPAATGAVAYAWYVDNGAGGSLTLQAVTTLNSILLKSLTTTGQASTAITGDHSYNQGGTQNGQTLVTAMDGIMYACYASNLVANSGRYLNGAYVNNLATGTAGTGTTLTASGTGTVSEIDTMFQSMWDNYQVGPTKMFMNSQQIKDVTNKCLSNTSAPLLHIFQDAKGQLGQFSAGGVIKWYYNKFSQLGGEYVEVIIHPFMPPGVIVAYAENLPTQYQSSEVPNVAEVHYRRDYYQIDWPPRTRAFESGVYSEETLAVYFPPAVGIIGNIAPG